MKLSSVKLGVMIIVVGLTICYAKAWSADWKEFAEATSGVFYYDKASVTSPSKGFFKAWIHNTTKHEASLIEIDCKEKNYRVLDVVEYDGNQIKARYDYRDNQNWLDITQKSVPEPLHSILCP